jgi:hypothetical protein
MSSESNSDETSIHSNTVKLYGSMIQNVTYINDSLDITTGQPSSPPPSIVHSGHEWKITLKCGRKNSKEVAESFNKISGGSAHEYSGGTIASSPSELNFFFGVNVVFVSGTTEFPMDLYFGQGSYATTNDWWMGGSNITSTGMSSAVILLVENNITKETLYLEGTNESFDFKTKI